jgi:hypothetical protein
LLVCLCGIERMELPLVVMCLRASCTLIRRPGRHDGFDCWRGTQGQTVTT